MKNYQFIVVCSIILWISIETNGQYFSASEGVTVGRIGRRSSYLSNLFKEKSENPASSSSQNQNNLADMTMAVSDPAKFSENARHTLRTFLSRFHAKRLNDLGLIGFANKGDLQNEQEFENRRLQEDETAMREYLIRYLVNDYLNN